MYTQKNHEKYLNNGFYYTKHTTSKDGKRIFWQCSRRRSGCRGRICTSSCDKREFIRLTNEHTCSSQKLEINEAIIKCPLCGRQIMPISMKRHFTRAVCTGVNSFFDSNDYSHIFNNISNDKQQNGHEEFLKLMNSGSPGSHKVYIISAVTKETPSFFDIIYIGITSDVNKRFRNHLSNGTFSSHKQIKITTFLEKLNKTNAEITESLLLMCCKPKSNMLNQKYEFRNLQALDIETEKFEERVKRFHGMALSLLKEKWDTLLWKVETTTNTHTKYIKQQETRKWEDRAKRGKIIFKKQKKNNFQKEEIKRLKQICGEPIEAEESSENNADDSFFSISSKSTTSPKKNCYFPKFS